MLQTAPRPVPQLPIVLPAGGRWELQIIAITGKFVLSVRQPGAKDLYSNAVVEKQLGISATTRNWNTIDTVCQILQPPPAPKS